MELLLDTANLEAIRKYHDYDAVTDLRIANLKKDWADLYGERRIYELD